MRKERYAARVKSAEISAIRVMMSAAPPDAIHLGLGEPDFQPPKQVIDALKKAVDNGHNHYGATLGLNDLRRAVVERESSKRSDLTIDNVMMTVGATGGLMVTMQAFVDEGDEVLIPNPGFVLYEPQVAFCGGRAVSYSIKEKNNFLPEIEEIKSLITPKTKIIIVNSPSNPTGGVLSEEHVNAIADIARDHNLIVVTDEVYDEIIYDNTHHSFLGKYDKLVYINSFSKTYAMTGWRVGYMIAAPEVIKVFEKIQYCDIACPPTPFQYALVEAMKASQDFIKGMLKEFKLRRDLIVGELNSIEGFRCIPPKGSIYVFPSFTYKIPSRELAMKILEKGVICGPGRAFGSMGEGHIRFSYANTIEKIEKGMEAVRAAVKGL